jgi:gas vesicle protein
MFSNELALHKSHCSERSRMKKLLYAFTGAAIGAATMLFLDPVAGRRRRHVLRDKAGSKLKKAQRAAEVVSKDLKNRIQGLMHGDFSPRKLDILQENWAPATRFAVGAGATALAFAARSRRGLVGLMWEGVALGMLGEAISNCSLRSKMRDIGRQSARTAEQPTAGSDKPGLKVGE